MRSQARFLIRKINESEPSASPPTDAEVNFMLSYLRGRGVKPVIVGGRAARHYVTKPETWSGRNVGDLDVFVSRRPPQPPQDWDVDREAPGITSWIAPSGGRVDFMTSGYEFPGGERVPTRLFVNTDADLPIVSFDDLFRMKLNSMRTSDLNDLVALARNAGRVPDERSLGRLNARQRENLELVRLWYQEKPTGAYGE